MANDLYRKKIHEYTLKNESGGEKIKVYSDMDNIYDYLKDYTIDDRRALNKHTTEEIRSELKKVDDYHKLRRKYSELYEDERNFEKTTKQRDELLTKMKNIETDLLRNGIIDLDIIYY